MKERRERKKKEIRIGGEEIKELTGVYIGRRWGSYIERRERERERERERGLNCEWIWFWLRVGLKAFKAARI